MRSRICHIAGLTLALLLCSGARLSAQSDEVISSVPTNIVAHLQQQLITARERFAAEPTNHIAAWQLGRACFAWGNLLKTPAAKEKVFREGVTACRHSLALDAQSAPANYYLGMNIGRIADLKRNLSAFNMVKEVERSFERARQIDEKFSFAGPDRNLGLLYQNAPGWPLSVGDKKLARKHLQRASNLASDYPENRLNLAEAALEWKDTKLFQSELAALEKLWPHAQTNLTGPDWELDWLDWEQRLKALRQRLNRK